MQTFSVQILCPEQPLGAKRVQELRVWTQEGQVAVRANHCDAIFLLKAGACTLYDDGQLRYGYYVGGGVLRIEDGHATVLGDHFEAADQIDQARVDAAVQRALERLAMKSSADIDIPRALRSLDRAQARKDLLQLRQP